jgi:cysteine desulfurase / selenocysteine lyase
MNFPFEGTIPISCRTHYSSRVNLTDVLSNETLRQAEFPVTRKKVFLAHAAVAPIPQRVAAAVRQYAELCTQGDQETLLPVSQMQQSRALAARLLGARPEEIAFVGPTSNALSLVAAGLRWRKGDNLILYLDDYPSNVYPWMALSEKGVEVRCLTTQSLGRIRPQDVLGHVDERTRLVALASCHFVSGHRIDLDAIGSWLRARQVLFCVDAIQTVGAFPTPVEHVDFLAADAHKWLLGPCAAGILYVRREIQDQLHPVLLGWHNVQCPDFVAREHITLRSDARRYEAGTHNLLGLVGLHAAMELLLEVGIDAIAAELLRKRAFLVPALQARGFTVLGANAAPENTSGIVSFTKADADMPAVQQRLETAGIVTSLRTDRTGKRYVRLSPHFYNTDAELQHLLDSL